MVTPITAEQAMKHIEQALLDHPYDWVKCRAAIGAIIKAHRGLL